MNLPDAIAHVSATGESDIRSQSEKSSLPKKGIGCYAEVEEASMEQEIEFNTAKAYELSKIVEMKLAMFEEAG